MRDNNTDRMMIFLVDIPSFLSGKHDILITIKINPFGK